MSILDKVEIGSSVKVNLKLTKDRLNKDIIDAINVSSLGIIREFKITDGKGIGVILKLSNGKEQWFFENEIDIIDEFGNTIKNDVHKKARNKTIYKIIKNLKYQNKKNINELLNPLNFIVWLIVSLKDIF